MYLIKCLQGLYLTAWYPIVLGEEGHGETKVEGKKGMASYRKEKREEFELGFFSHFS